MRKIVQIFVCFSESLNFNSQFNVPIFVYQVSGEYSMIKAASQNKWLNEKRIVLETLMSMKRAGANAIISYYAKDALKWMK